MAEGYIFLYHFTMYVIRFNPATNVCKQYIARFSQDMNLDSVDDSPTSVFTDSLPYNPLTLFCNAHNIYSEEVADSGFTFMLVQDEESVEGFAQHTESGDLWYYYVCGPYRDGGGEFFDNVSVLEEYAIYRFSRLLEGHIKGNVDRSTGYGHFDVTDLSSVLYLDKTGEIVKKPVNDSDKLPCDKFAVLEYSFAGGLEVHFIAVAEDALSDEEYDISFLLHRFELLPKNVSVFPVRIDKERGGSIWRSKELDAPLYATDITDSLYLIKTVFEFRSPGLDHLHAESIFLDYLVYLITDGQIRIDGFERLHVMKKENNNGDVWKRVRVH